MLIIIGVIAFVPSAVWGPLLAFFIAASVIYLAAKRSRAKRAAEAFGPTLEELVPKAPPKPRPNRSSTPAPTSNKQTVPPPVVSQVEQPTQQRPPLRSLPSLTGRSLQSATFRGGAHIEPTARDIPVVAVPPLPVAKAQAPEAMSTSRVAPPAGVPPLPPDPPVPLPPPAVTRSVDDELVRHVVEAPEHVEILPSKLPPAPVSAQRPRWIGFHEVVSLADITLTGGGFYFGRSTTSSIGVDACVIDTRQPVATKGDITQGPEEYWPNYAQLTPHQRRGYFTWLSSGRSQPECSIGFVFLYFYGLERRVIVDGEKMPGARAEWPDIAEEIRRLLSIYGDCSPSFRRCASNLLEWIELSNASKKLYAISPPHFPPAYEVPIYLRLALGQAAVDRVPVPAELALAWVRHSPTIRLRTPATRCPVEFESLFTLRYHEVFGAGLSLPRNKTKLKFVYRPANYGVQTANLTLSFGDVPDVTVLTGPNRKLQELVDQCTDELSGYSRVIGRNPEASNTLDGLIHLPRVLWPEAARQRVQELASRIDGYGNTMTLEDFLDALGGTTQNITREKLSNVAELLGEHGLGLEPDVTAGARVPSAKSPVVVFRVPPDIRHQEDPGRYHVSQLTLQLASAVARADGVFSDDEAAHLNREIAAWAHLSPHDIARLHAHLEWLRRVPVTLTSLKAKLEPLPTSTREALAASMATLTQADGNVSPDELIFLEKVYKALGVDAKRVFTDVHTSAPGTPARPTASKPGFALDHERVAALQRDTDRVSALLADIFKEDSDADPVLPMLPAEEDEDPTQATEGLWDLDEDHSSLARLLLTRPQWARSELEDAASDLGLMLDGALERINEACLDVHDIPLVEGDDPLEVSVEIMEIIEA
ncbi:TerB N-terminal domain-containing protein [Luteibacter jiangsuensis]